METNSELQTLVGNILKDIRIELTDEFDKNFQRQAFFSQAWARRKSPLRPGGSTLIDTGHLRQSIGSRNTADTITFFSTLPYAAIHNEGGEIKITRKMRRFFWHKFYEARGTFGRKKNGEKRKDKRTEQLTDVAQFWKAMALTKSKTIRIPKRQFLGASPEVEDAVRQIIEENLSDYFEHDFKLKADL